MTEARFQIVPYAGANLLYRAATGLERAMADVEAERLLATYDKLIDDQWDPYAISEENLPYLGWAMGALLWESGWALDTKREWTARQWEYKALRGTLAGHRMALEFSGRDFTGGYEIVEALTPPQGFYASPDLTKDEWDYWVRQMPELRIKLSRGVGTAPGDEWFGDDGFSDVHAAGRDDGYVLYGRKAVLRRAGVDQPLEIARFETTVLGRRALDYERVSSVGLSTMGYVANEDFADDERFVCAEEITPEITTLRLDRAYEHISSVLHLDTVVPGLEPLDVKYERTSDTGEAGPFIYANADYANEYFADTDWQAADMLADRIYLYDPAVAGIMTEGVSFAGVDYVSWPRYTAELLVDLNAKDRRFSWFAEEGFVAGDGFASAEYLDDNDRALRAVDTTKALRDRVLVDFGHIRPLTADDIVGEETLAGHHVRQLL